MLALVIRLDRKAETWHPELSIKQWTVMDNPFFINKLY